MLNPLKPWYVYRPRQLLLRVARGLGEARGPRPVALPWGLTLTVDPSQLIGKSIWRTGVFELLVSEALFRLVEPGDVVVDVGANIGYMASILGLAAGPAGHLHAFEPSPPVFERLRGNVAGFRRHPGFAAVTLHAEALGEHGGRAELHLPHDIDSNDGAAQIARGGTAGHVPITIRRLDDVLAGAEIGVLKLDVEGFEDSVLRGATALLKTNKVRDVLYEDHVGPDGATANLLRGFGYAVFRLEGRLTGLRLVAASEPERGPRWESPCFVGTRRPGEVVSRLNTRGWRALGA
ncbi:MAG: FkbM family methyltransferase [Gemmataceae bacterium]